MKGLLIEIEKCYKCEECTAECSYPYHPFNKGIYRLIEDAIRVIPCRHCEDAPCVTACPTDALKKEGEHLRRSGFLCTSCKSCVVACPFGVNILETIVFQRHICDLCETRPDQRICIDTCSEKALHFTDVKEDPEQDIYKIWDGLFAKGIHWKKQLGIKI